MIEDGSGSMQIEVTFTPLHDDFCFYFNNDLTIR